MKLDIQQIYDAARAAGFTPDQATTWTAIAMAESGGNTDAHNPHGENSFGLWQINIAPGVRQNVWGNLDDPYVNAQAAYAISDHGTDMRPWTTTHASNEGTAADYRTYLGEVSAVTGFAGDDRGVDGYSSPLPAPLDPSSPTAAADTSYDVIDLGSQPGSDLDSDNDGLTDAFENMVGTDPNVADTDQDGLSDAYEVGVSHTNPLVADTDGDSLSDATEVALGTSPTTFDTDADGASDGLEVRHGFDPLVPQGNASPSSGAASVVSTSAALGASSQGDGSAGLGSVTNAQHTFQGTDPWAKTSLDGETVDNFTAAALQSAAREAGTNWHVMQGSFSDDVAASGSTHAGGGVVDVAPTDGDWEGAVTALRKIGFAAWIRNAPGHASVGSGEHIHAVLIGDKLMSDQAAIQVQSYLNDDNGLEGSAPDDGPRQFVNNRFSWDAVTGDSATDATAYDQIDAGVMPAQPGDADGDGLSDTFERAHGFDPHSADTDHDGQPDGLELLHGTNPLVADAAVVGAAGAGAGTSAATGAGLTVSTASLGGLLPDGDEDGDHLSNAFEIEHGLDPRSADTDHDGLSDATELALGTNPNSVDTDMDGFTDRAELQFGTDPLVSDHDATGAFVPEADQTALEHAWPDGDTDVGH